MQKSCTATIEFTRTKVDKILVEHACNELGVTFEPTKDRVSVYIPDGGLFRDVIITVEHGFAVDSLVSHKTKLVMSHKEACQVLSTTASAFEGCPTVYANAEVCLSVVLARVTFTL